MSSSRFDHRLRQLERAVEAAAPAGEKPLAMITLRDLGELVRVERTGDLDAIAESRRQMARQLRRRRIAGRRAEWPDVPQFLAIRDMLERYV